VNLESLTVEEAQVKLVQHYLSALGPATEEDIVWWTGLGKREIRQALATIEQELTEMEIEGLGEGYLVLASDLRGLQGRYQGERRTNLLPSLDAYVMGYRDQRRFLGRSRHGEVFDRAGNALPTVWLDGKVIGVWLENRERSMLEVLLFQEPDKRVIAELEAEAQRLACFLEHGPATVQLDLYPDAAYPKSPFTLVRKQ